jgi:serine/threonine-protein kinase HipA
MTELDVELYGRRIGTLAGERETFDFHPDADAVRLHGAGSTILSIAVPLVTARSTDPALRELRRNFFEEILAEGRIRERLGQKARLDPDNTMGLLRRYGRDVAGAVQIWDPDDPEEPRTPEASPVTDERIAEMFAEVAANPLGNKGRRRLSSLAGVQDKVLLARTHDGWAEPLDGFPSTHILKPRVPAMPSLIFDEEYGSRIVRALGLAEFSTSIESFPGTRALVIERYDRDPERNRIHQEDFNQVLGFRGDAKYEPAQGDGRLHRIAGVIREHARASDLAGLVRMMTLSAAVGNLDMHAKNISILHLTDGEVELAPMYDVVPQMHQPVDQETALLINGTSDIHSLTGADIVAEAEGWGVRRARAVVEGALEQVREVARRETPLAGAHHSVDADIIRQSSRLLDTLDASSTRLSSPDADVVVEQAFASRNAPGGWGGPVA